MKVTVLGYYSSINKGNIWMLKGFFHFFPVKKVYLPVLYPHVEKLIIKREKMRKKVEVVWFLNLFKLLNLILKSKNIFFLFGDTLTGEYGLFSNFFALLNLTFLLFIGRKSIILPSTLLPSKFSKSFLKFFLKRAKKIYIREKNSLKELKIINKNTFVAKDLAVFYLNTKKSTNKEKRKIITLVLRNSTPKLLGIERKKFVDLITEQLSFILKKYPKYRFILLPFQIGVRRKNDDRIILREIYESMKNYKKRVVFLKEYLTLEKVLKIISKSVMLISSRFHACLIAYKVGTPFIALNENFKIANFARKKGILLNKTDLEKVSKYLDINLI